MDDTFSFGADIVGLPLDAVREDIYTRVRGGSFEKALALIEKASEKYPYRISTHLMLGLGEAEKDVVELLCKLTSWGVTVGLFALTPMKGTALASATPPDLSSYRRIQAAKALIVTGYSDFEFDRQGKISSFELSYDETRKKLPRWAFETSGCAGCNRPFYNESPGGVLYNYPRPLSDPEFFKALKEVEIL